MNIGKMSTSFKSNKDEFTLNGAGSTHPAALWASNVATSVAIVFANKKLMQGHSFRFASCLTALHFAVSAVVLRSAKQNPAGRKQIGALRMAVFVAISSLSIVALNLSLLLNTVAFYQVSKLLIVPSTAVLEWVILNERIRRKDFWLILLILSGVGIVTIDDFNLKLTGLGLFIAVISIVASSLQQIFVRKALLDSSMSSSALLAAVAPIQAAAMFVCGPFIDKAVSSQWVFEYHWNFSAVLALSISCGLAVLVNISQFGCLGKFSALSFQLLGHVKTLLVFTLSWLFFAETMTVYRTAGIFMAMVGIAIFGRDKGRMKK